MIPRTLNTHSHQSVGNSPAWRPCDAGPNAMPADGPPADVMLQSTVIDRAESLGREARRPGGGAKLSAVQLLTDPPPSDGCAKLHNRWASAVSGEEFDNQSDSATQRKTPARLGRGQAFPGSVEFSVHLTSTFAPTPSRAFLAFSASSLLAFSRMVAGSASTLSLASLRPRPVIARTSLITLIFASSG